MDSSPRYRAIGPRVYDHEGGRRLVKDFGGMRAPTPVRKTKRGIVFRISAGFDDGYQDACDSASAFTGVLNEACKRGGPRWERMLRDLGVAVDVTASPLHGRR